MHPCTMEYFASIDHSVPIPTLYRRVAQLVKSGHLLDCGNVRTKSLGRPEKLFATWQVQEKLKQHELGLTDWLAWTGFLDAPVQRGPHVNKVFRPDATLGVMHIEWDTGKLSHKQVEERMLVYQNCDDFVLFVTRSEERLDNLWDCFRGLDGVLFVTCVGRTYADDLHGTRKTLEYLLTNATKRREKLPPHVAATP